MSWRVSSIHTYPVKGLPGQSLSSAKALHNGLLSGDRRYALTSGTIESQTASSDSWLKKAHFLQMMSLAELAALTVTFDPATSHLRLTKTADHTAIYEGKLDDRADSLRLCQVMADYLTMPDNAPLPRLFHLKQGGLTDTKTPFVAFGNQASITDFAEKDGHTDDDRRYRLNVILQGEPAWSEFDLIGKSVRLGTAEFTFVEPVGRCAAIEVDPQTAYRKKGLVQSLQAHYGHTDMGVFASVTKSGTVSVGDQVEILATGNH